MLSGKRIAILVEEGFGDSELIESLRAMKAVEARVVIVGADSTQSYQSQNGKKIITAEVTADKALADDFDAIIIPSVHSPNEKRFHSSVIDLVKKMQDSGKLIAAICCGPQLLISADIARGCRLTSSLLIAEDLKNAGADRIDVPVVTDANIITARKAIDLPVFNWTIIEALRVNDHSAYTGVP